jgi:tRNA-binding protein
MKDIPFFMAFSFARGARNRDRIIGASGIMVGRKAALRQCQYIMDTVTYDEFAKLELRVGTIIQAEPFPEARKPAIKLWVDFGPDIGTLKTSAQITAHYTPESLIGRQIVGCINLGIRQIGSFMSEFLCTGFSDENGGIVLITPDRKVPNGQKLH